MKDNTAVRIAAKRLLRGNLPGALAVLERQAADVVTCPDCDGAGEVEECPRPGFCSHENHRSWPCSTCDGQGEATPERIAEARARECDCGTPVGDITNPDLHRRCYLIGDRS